MVKISVIMPVFNAEKYLEEALNSILNQTFSDIELLCVDDGSLDNSLNMLYDFEKKDSRIQVFHQENNGGGAARNLVLPKAKGKYIYFMDADDILELNALQEFYDIAEEKKVDFIICKAINYNSDINEYYETEYFSMNKVYNYVGDEIFNWKDIGDLIFYISVTPWGKFFNREFVINSGARFAEGLIFHDNIFFWEVLFNSKNIFFYNKILCYRRVHSKSSVESKDKRFVSTIPIHNMIIDLFKKYNQYDKFRQQLYNKQIRLANMRFNEIDVKFKDYFFKEMKKDFVKLSKQEDYEKIIEIIHPNNKNILNNVLKSNNEVEYQLLMEIYDLKNEIKELKKKNKKLKKKNKKLKKQYNELKNSSGFFKLINKLR